MPNITLDLHTINAVNDVHINNKDKIIKVSLREGRRPFHLAQGCVVTLTALKEEERWQKECAVDGSEIYCNFVYFSAGRYECEFVITDDNHRLTTPRFTVDYKEE